MEYNMRQSVFFDKFIESTVNHLAFHRTAIAGAKDQVIVDVFVTGCEITVALVVAVEADASVTVIVYAPTIKLVML